MKSARAEFVAGVRAELPILLGVAPFGMIYGALAIAAGLPNAPAMAMSSILFAGSAQFVSAQLLAVGVPGVVIVMTVVVVNLRHMLYSASIAPYVQELPRRWRWLLAYLLTDEAFAVAIMRYRRTQEHALAHFYFLGAGVALWTTWQFTTATGIFLGAQMPASWSLDFTLALTFIALLVPAVEQRSDLAAALSAGLVALFTYSWPFKLGLVVASILGVTVGLMVERRAQSSVPRRSQS